MMMGQAAGVTAALAIQEKTSVQDVSIKALQTKLRSQKAILHLDQEATGTGVD
jgi:hypothetical protein